MNECYKIHTLPVLRNEIKMYNALKHERDKIIEDYEKPLEELKLKLLEVEEKLMLIKSPGGGNGLGGFVQDSLEKFNYLIDKKTKLENERNKYIKANRDRYLTEFFEVKRRIDVIEYYLLKLDNADREFIEDFYVRKVTKTEVMKRYNILNNKSLYRKADNILMKML